MPPVLVSISIAPDPATCTDEGQVQLTATGHYDDASTADLTGECYWFVTEDYPVVATVGSGGGRPGLVSGVSVGVAEVNAQWPTFFVVGG